MNFVDESGFSNDPSLYLLKVPIQALAAVQPLAGYVSYQIATDDPTQVLVQVVPNSACDLYIRQ